MHLFYPPEHQPEICKERVVQVAANIAAISLATIGGGFNSFLGRNPQVQTALLAGALPIAMVGAWAGWVADRREPYLAMRTQLGIENYAEQLSSSPIAVIPPANQGQMDFFDWAIINRIPHKWPHLAVCGGTGDGKSTLAQALIQFLNEPAIAVDPHYKPGNYPGLPCVAKGRNYGSYPGRDVGFERLAGTEEISYSDVISTLLSEMDRRYKLLEKGKAQFPFYSFICDEFNTFIAEAGKKASQDVLKIIREARKVNLRLILLLQSDLLKDLGWEGQGAARKSLRWIRLNEFAVSHAKSSLKDSELSEWVKSQRHPILVESQPAILPAAPLDWRKLERIYNSSPVGEADSPIGEADSPIGEADSLAESQSEQAFRAFAETGSPPGERGAEWCEAAKTKAPIRSLTRGEAREKIIEMITNGTSQTSIVQSLWGVKKGGNYPAWDKAVKEFKKLIR